MPLYDKIIDDIMKKIESGDLKTGDMLPTEMEFSASYGVSRPTVRTAMLKLVNQGYLNRVKGTGTFVTKPKLVQGYTQFIESYNEEMRSKGLEPQTVVLDFQIMDCPDFVINKLELDKGSKVMKLRRLRFVQPSDEERPVVLTTVYVPEKLATGLDRCNFEKTSLYDALKDKGIMVSHVRREIEVRMLHGRTARLLSSKEGAAAHFISSVGYDSERRPVEYSESFYPADRNKFIIEINR